MNLYYTIWIEPGPRVPYTTPDKEYLVIGSAPSLYRGEPDSFIIVGDSGKLQTVDMDEVKVTRIGGKTEL